MKKLIISKINFILWGESRQQHYSSSRNKWLKNQLNLKSQVKINFHLMKRVRWTEHYAWNKEKLMNNLRKKRNILIKRGRRRIREGYKQKDILSIPSQNTLLAIMIKIKQLIIKNGDSCSYNPSWFRWYFAFKNY